MMNECNKTYIDSEVGDLLCTYNIDSSIFQATINFIKTPDRKSFLILGESGTGKTRFCLELLKHMERLGLDIAPVYIYLPLVEDPQTSLLEESLAVYQKRSEIVALSRFLFIIDGYDELKDRTNLISSNRIFEKYPESKVIFTCHLDKIRNVHNFVSIQDEVPQIYELSAIRIKPFSQKQRREFIMNFFQHIRSENEIKTIVKRLENSHQLKSVLNDTLLLKMCLYSPYVLETIREEKVNLFDLYSYCIGQAYTKEIRNFSCDEFFNFCIDLAFEVYAKRSYMTCLKGNEKTRSIMNIFPLKYYTANGKHKVFFRHPSFIYYFIAFRVKHIIETSFLGSLKEINSINLSKNKQIFNFIQDYIQENHIKVLLKIVRCKNPELSIARVNSFAILKHIEHPFTKEELEFIEIPGADLSMGKLASVNMFRGNMQGANVANANFINAELLNSNLLNTSLGVSTFRNPHLSAVKAIQFSENGKIAVSWNEEGIRIRSILSHEIIRINDFQENSVETVALSPDGVYLASTCENLVKIWNLRTSELINLLESSSIVISVAFSPNRRTLVTGLQDKSLTFRNTNSGAYINRLEHSSPVYSLSFSPDGSFLALGCKEKSLHIVKFPSAEPHKTIKTFSPFIIICFSPDGRVLATSNSNKSIILTNFENSCVIKHFNCTAVSTALCFSSDGRILASAFEDKAVNLWDLREYSYLDSIVHINRVISICFTQLGKEIAIGDATGSIYSYSMSSILQKKMLDGHSLRINSVAYSMDGKWLASASEDKTVKLWNSKTKNLERILVHSSYVNSVCFSPNCKILASGTKDDIIIWDLSTASQVHKLDHFYHVSSVSFSADGLMLVSGSHGKSIKVWDVESGTLVKSLQVECVVRFVCFSPDGNSVVSLMPHKYVKVWNFINDTTVNLDRYEKRVAAMCYAPDGRTLALADHCYGIILWDIVQARESSLLKDNSQSVSLSFSLDGMLLASACIDRSVRLWNFPRRELVMILNHSCIVKSVCFSPDRRFIVSGDTNGVIKQWSLKF